jgi:glycosyltransferase involved in cell wall biosynthesis
VAVEAFARGRPVVASRAGGIPDIVEDGISGLLVPPGDARALADALVRVLAERDLAERLGDGAREAAARWVATPEDYAARMREAVEAL